MNFLAENVAEPSTEFHDDDLVLVSPRYLAGAGLNRLADATGGPKR